MRDEGRGTRQCCGVRIRPHLQLDGGDRAGTGKHAGRNPHQVRVRNPNPFARILLQFLSGFQDVRLVPRNSLSGGIVVVTSAVDGQLLNPVRLCGRPGHRATGSGRISPDRLYLLRSCGRRRRGLGRFGRHGGPAGTGGFLHGDGRGGGLKLGLQMGDVGEGQPFGLAFL